MAWREDLSHFISDLSVGVHVYRDGSVIEGHRGLLTYTPTCVKVRRRVGSVTIDGEGLFVRQITRDEIWIAGTVKAVTIDG